MKDILSLNIGEVQLTETGEVLILHLLGCNNCASYGAVYINMSTVDENDKVHNIYCPLCKEESLELITYRVMDRIKEIEDEDQEDGGGL